MTMNNDKLKKLQQDLEKQCYLESEKCGHDMRGQMEYCKGCVFKTIGKETTQGECVLDYTSMSLNWVCAKKYLKEIEK